MKVYDISGKEHKLDTRTKTFPMRTERACKSKFQYEIGQILLTTFPYDIILEEVSIPGEKLFLDFLLPQKRLAVECHGQQHGEYSEFFHGSPAGFIRSKDRDSRKREWCEINNIELVEFHSIEEAREFFK